MQPPVLEKLKDKIITAGPLIDIIETRLRALEKRDLAKGKAITQLQQERDRGLASKAKLQQKTLLGQIAYTISDILEEFVFGEEESSSFLPISISDFANNNMQLTEQQQARWAAAQAFFTSSMPLDEIIEVDRYLRWLSNGPAHGRSVTQTRDTKAAQLHAWAGVHCKAKKAVTSVQRYLQVLNKLSTEDRPLAPNISLAKLVQQQLQ